MPLFTDSKTTLPREWRRRGFTLVELLVVIAIIGVVSAFLLSALARTQDRTQGIICLNNTKQLTLAAHIYAADSTDNLPYNLNLAGSAFRTDKNWANNVLTWKLDSDNTNLNTLTKASLGIFVGNPAAYRCPSDRALSETQKNAGWTTRIRSYSMNATMGNAESISPKNYKQFLKTAQVPVPSEMFVFLDEHPDSINDGYFFNQPVVANNSNAQWTSLPASYHNRAAALSYADGHSSFHRWQLASTARPALPQAAALPVAIPARAASLIDFNWVVSHSSVISTEPEHD